MLLVELGALTVDGGDLAARCSGKGAAGSPLARVAHPQIHRMRPKFESAPVATAPTPGSTAVPNAVPATTPSVAALPPCVSDTASKLGLTDTQSELERRYGPPSTRKQFRAGELQGEFHVGIENVYPSTDPRTGTSRSSSGRGSRGPAPGASGSIARGRLAGPRRRLLAREHRVLS